MRILVLNYEFPPLGGGASPVSYEIAKGYIREGHHVAVVTMSYKGLPEHETREGIEIYRVPCIRKKKEICRPWEMLSYTVSAKRFLKQHLKTHNYDLNHTHFIIPTGIVSSWANKKFGLPYIVTAHGSDVPGYNNDRFKALHLFTKPMLKDVCSKAKRIISPSRYLAGLIEKEIGCTAEIIPNGIYPDKFTPKEKRRVILSTGRLLPRKGFQHLIKAVSDDDIGYELHIAGDGPMKDELTRLAGKSKTKVILHGWLDNNGSRYKELLEHASIYVLASEKENASVALLEAMSAGCAVITTDISGCPETVGDTGFLVKPRDPSGIREKLRLLIGDDKLMKKAQAKARERIEKEFDWERICRDYLR
jgi:glycosyltransferase involved in cell wall biosynthesis